MGEREGTQRNLGIGDALCLALLLEQVGNPLADHRGGARDHGEYLGLHDASLEGNERGGRCDQLEPLEHERVRVEGQVEQPHQLVTELGGGLLLEVGARRDGELLRHVARQHRHRAQARGERDHLAGGGGGLLRAHDDARDEKKTDGDAGARVRQQGHVGRDVKNVLHDDKRRARAKGGEHRVSEDLKRDPLEPAAHSQRPGLGLLLMQVRILQH
mmetsp:Transcript_32765/g.104525  ORF Transcript_32765/g.104525 Transcript_32765/m.104525 type:complete len:215 (-) Transcript_32765:87-731(-)